MKKNPLPSETDPRYDDLARRAARRELVDLATRLYRDLERADDASHVMVDLCIADAPDVCEVVNELLKGMGSTYRLARTDDKAEP